MNVLISANKWRLRLETGDLERLLATGQLLSTLGIPGIAPLEFGIVLEDPLSPQHLVSLKPSGLVARISRASAEKLLHEKPSKLAGLRHTVETASGQSVTLIVEQDLFKQRTPREPSANTHEATPLRAEDTP